jgi:hypothetical protein
MEALVLTFPLGFLLGLPGRGFEVLFAEADFESCFLACFGEEDAGY